jgi:aryl-alcohol dehydrogenase-like predicted oxidoreductase
MPMSVTTSRPGEADSVRVLVRAAELGVTLWDTADAYCIDDTETGHNERLFGAALKALDSATRETVVIATKGGHVRPGGRWETDGRPSHIREAVDASLKALDVDKIDLYQFHRPDPKVPFEDTVGAFAEVYAAGKVRFVGLSNVSAAQIDIAMKIVPVVSVQNHYNPKARQAERDGVIEKCRELGLAFLPYSPLGGMGGAKSIGETGALSSVASAHGVSPQQIVLAWMLTKYDRLIPIPGVSRLTSLEDSAKASDVVLTADEVATLDASFA